MIAPSPTPVSSWPAALADRVPDAAVLNAVDLGLGLVLILGGPLRTSSRSYAGAAAVMPLTMWGWALLTLAVVTATAHFAAPRVRVGVDPLLRGVPLALTSSWHAFFAASLLMTAAMDHKAGLTGVPAYLGYVALHLLAAFRHEDR